MNKSNNILDFPIISAALKRAQNQGVAWAKQLKQKYPNKSQDELSETVIQSAMWRTAGSGAASSIGGVISLAAGGGDLLYFLYAEVELAAAILSIFEFNISDESEQPLLLAAVLGLSVNELLRLVGGKLGERAISRVLRQKALTTILNRGVWNMGRLIPLGGAILSGGLNALMMRTAGVALIKFAKRHQQQRGNFETVEIAEVIVLD